MEEIRQQTKICDSIGYSFLPGSGIWASRMTSLGRRAGFSEANDVCDVIDRTTLFPCRHHKGNTGIEARDGPCIHGGKRSGRRPKGRPVPAVPEGGK